MVYGKSTPEHLGSTDNTRTPAKHKRDKALLGNLAPPKHCQNTTGTPDNTTTTAAAAAATATTTTASKTHHYPGGLGSVPVAFWSRPTGPVVFRSHNTGKPSKHNQRKTLSRHNKNICGNHPNTIGTPPKHHRDTQTRTRNDRDIIQTPAGHRD